MDVHADAQLESSKVSTVGAVGDERLATDPEDLDFTHRPRKHDDDEGSDSGDDDAESATSAQVAGNSKELAAADEEKELPSHACA